MATYLLIHGGWHQREHWLRIAARLTAHGHRVFVPNLAGRGEDPRSLATIWPQHYLGSIEPMLFAGEEPVILMGHSMAGMVISQAAEQYPERIRALVYVCAFLLDIGQNPIEMLVPSPGLREEDSSCILRYMSIDRERAEIRVDLSTDTEGSYKVADALYNRCTPEDVRFAVAYLVPEPLAAIQLRVDGTTARFGSVPRYYIETGQDRTLPLVLQRQMQETWPCRKTFSLEMADHSPFLSAPGQLVDCLLAVANR